MKIPAEPIGSIPRPPELLEAINAAGDGTDPELDTLAACISSGAISGSPAFRRSRKRSMRETRSCNSRGATSARAASRDPLNVVHVERLEFGGHTLCAVPREQFLADGIENRVLNCIASDANSVRAGIAVDET